MTTPHRATRLESFRSFMSDPLLFPLEFKAWLGQYLLVNQPAFQISQLIGYKPRTAGISTQTPGAVATVNIGHGMTIAPAGYSVSPGNANARGAPAFYVTADASNLILNFGSNLTAATAYTWAWVAQGP